MTFHLDQPAIYLITKGEATPANFALTSLQILNIIRIAVDERVPLVQLREKKLTARLLFELTVAAAEITRGSATRLLVNDRADIAATAGADGVHLTSTSISAQVVRRTFSPKMIIGVSTHSIEAARSAAEQGADLAVFAPVFASPGKGEPHGITTLKKVCDGLGPFSIIGLGGVDETNYRDVIDAGASGFAAIRWLNDPDKLRSVARGLRK